MTKLAQHLLEGRESIARAWREEVRNARPARALPDATLDRHLPRVLEALGEAPETVRDAARVHATERIALGYDLEEVLEEYAALRRCVLARWGATTPDDPPRRLDAAIDALVAAAASTFCDLRAQALATLDRIAEEAVGIPEPDGFLRQLLRAATGSARHVSVAGVLVGDAELRPAALAGIEPDAAGLLARAVSADAAPPADLDLRSVWWRRLALRQQTLGLAFVGSRRADAFSREDHLRYDAMASRATCIVAHAREVEEERASQRALAASIDRERVVSGVAERWVATLGAVLQSIPDAVLVGDEEGVRAANRAAVALTGAASEEELVGPVATVIARLDPRCPATAARVPDDAVPFSRALRGERCATELVLGGARRGDVVVLASAAPVELSGRTLGAVMVLADVTARKRAADQERFLSTVSATLAESLDYETTLAAVARLAVPTFADSVVVHLAGPRGNIRPVAVADARPDREAVARDMLGRYAIDPAAGYGVARVLRTGETLWEREVPDPPSGGINAEVVRALAVRSYVLVPLLARGRTLGTLAFVGTDERRFDEGDVEFAKELGRRGGVAVDNSLLYRESQDAIGLRDRVLAVVSHDLRNPLGTVKLAVALLKATPCGADPAAGKQLDMLARSASRMERLIRDLLDMANIQAGKLSVTCAPVDADALVADAAEHHGPLVSVAGRQLDVDLDARGARVHCDRERILQVVDNLVGNAVKFSRPGGRITLAVRAEDDAVAFVVSDTGVGIPRADLPHVFDAYWKGRTPHAAQAGTGLGLYICKGIVEAHGGAITVASEEGVGTTFTFRLPRH